jgi:hypothetical protein
MKKWIRPIWIFIILSLWIINVVMYTVASEYILFNKALLGSAIGLTLLFLMVNKKRIQAFFSKPYQRNFTTNSITIFISDINYYAFESLKFRA